jgi:hypothetical protein
VPSFIDPSQIDTALEQGFQRGIMTHEHQGRPDLPAFVEQQPNEGLAAIGIQRRGGLVGDQQLRRTIRARAAATRCC